MNVKFTMTKVISFLVISLWLTACSDFGRTSDEYYQIAAKHYQANDKTSAIIELKMLSRKIHSTSILENYLVKFIISKVSFCRQRKSYQMLFV